MTDIKLILKEFDRFSYGQSKHTAFTELVDWTLLPFKKWDNAEQQNQALDTYQNHPKVTQLVKLVEIIGEASEGFSDPLGELYQQAISSGHNGQYFTPEHLCVMISDMIIGDDLKDGQTICDPACGSGRMILATAKHNRFGIFYGADLDITCCKMALINLLLNSLSGEVAHMNTLTNEFYRGYKVDTILVDNQYLPYYTEFINPKESYIWLKPLPNQSYDNIRSSKPIDGLQGRLF